MHRLLILFIFCTQLVQAQQSVIDSLKRELDAHPAEDTNRFARLTEYSYLMRTVDINVSMEYIRKAYALADELNLDAQRTTALYNIGDLYFMQSEHQKAYEYLQKALQITYRYSEKPWLHRRQVIQNLLAGVFSESNPPLAFKYLRESIATLRLQNNNVAICDKLSNMASLYAELHQSDSATYYFEEAIRCVRQERDQSNLPLMEMAYGRFLVDINEVTQSVPKLEAASAAFEQSNKLVELKSSLFSLAKAYLKIGKLQAAKSTIEKTKTIRVAFPDEEMNYAQFYVDWFERIHQPDSALVYLKKLSQLERKAYEKDRKNALEEQEVRFRTKEKEAENRQLEQNLAKSKLQNIILYIGLGFLFIIFLLNTYFWNRLRKANRQIKAAANKTAQVVASKRLMTNLMAHDLRAPLHAIQINASMLKIRQPDNAEASYIELAAQRIHQMALRIVEVQNEEQIDIEKRLMNVPVQTAIAQVAEQFELLAVSKKVSIQIEPNEQPTLAIAEPALLDNILGNLVSNAIKYSPAGGKISIKIKKLQDKVHIFIEDEGPGFDLPMEIAGDDLTLSQQASESGWGIGLKLTKQYVELMGGNLFLQTNHASGATFVVELMGVH